MANRAYLFSPEDEDYLLEMGDEYYDSRWNIPLLWFLFFDENSLMMLSRKEDEDDVLETFLVENKDIAIERFQNTFSKLNAVLDISEIDVEEFIENIKRWEGEQLVLDPMEIIEGEGENPESKTVKDYLSALRCLKCGEIKEFIEVVDYYAGEFAKVEKNDLQRIRNYFIGFTYW